MSFFRNPIVRWLLFLPTAILAACVVILLYRLFYGVWNSSAPSQMTFFGAIGEAFVQMLGTTALIYVAAWMVPKGKLVVSVVIATLSAVIVILGAIGSVAQHQYMFLIPIAGTLIGSFYATYLVFQDPPDMES